MPTLRGLPAYCRTELPATWSTVFGNPDRQSDLQEMRSRSPAGLVSRIKAPLLIAQGANNPLVRKEQVEQLVQALRAHAAKVEYLEFSDEGRELVRPENRIALAAAAEAFLARHLGGRQEAAAP